MRRSSDLIRLESRARVRGVQSQESVPRLTAGDGQQGVEKACGELRVGLADGVDLFSALGKPLVVRFDDNDGLRNQFVRLLTESRRPGIDSRLLRSEERRGGKECVVLGSLRGSVTS